MQKKQIILIISSLLVITLSVTLAFFKVQIIGDSKNIVVNSEDLKIIFNGGDDIGGINLQPGFSYTKLFSITNKSKESYDYDIVIKDLLNTFVTTGYLQYKITSDNGGYNMTDYEDVPKTLVISDITIAQRITIEKGVTQTYTVEFIYPNDENVDQSKDLKKEMKGKIFIKKASDFYANYDKGTIGYQLMKNNPNRKIRTDFSSIYDKTDTNTLFYTSENNQTVYYFAGKDNDTEKINNWIKFGKNSTGEELYWRIIRTNHDSSIRLLYHGTSTSDTATYVSISAYNTSPTVPRKVGFMYGNTNGLEYIHENINSSTVKSSLDKWYKNNMVNYTKYLSNDAVYCNDRQASKYSENNAFYFDAPLRVRNNYAPTYNCVNNNDSFSVNNSNAKLTYPTGLMTLDELIYAGGKLFDTSAINLWFSQNTLLTNSSDKAWLTMTPVYYDTYSATAIVFSEGNIGYGYGAINNATVRPVISLKSCVKYASGDGSSENPYTVLKTESGC